MKLHNILSIYEFYVDGLLAEYPDDYFAVRYTINNGIKTRAVFSFNRPLSLEEMFIQKKKIVEELMSRKNKKNLGKLIEIEEEIKLTQSGQKKEDPYNKIIDFEQFKTILVTHNKEAEKCVLKGEIYNLGNKLGYVAIRRVERNPENMTVDWKASNERKTQLLKEGKTLYDKYNNPDGHKYLVFYTDDFWFRIGWSKFRSIRNETVYQLVPCGGTTDIGYRENPKGLKHKMSKEVRENQEALIGKIKTYYYNPK